MGRSNINLVGNTVSGENLGDGAGVFKGKNTASNMQFKSISATGTSIQIFNRADDILISGSTGGGGGSITGGDNGLSTSGDKIILGGALTGDTLIDFSQGTLYISGETGNVELARGSGDYYGKISLANGQYNLRRQYGASNFSQIAASCANIEMCAENGYISIGSSGLGSNGTISLNPTQCLCIQLPSTGATSFIGKVCLQTTPGNGACTDNVLVWNSVDKLVKKVPYLSGGTGSGPITVTANDVIYTCKNIPAGLTSATNNILLGCDAGKSITTSSNNVALGLKALCLSNNTDGQNIAIGSYAIGCCNVAGYYNIGIGFHALAKTTGGYWNTAMGFQSLYTNTNGGYNIALGQCSSYSNTTGECNIALGVMALNSNSTGSRNIAIGNCAGYSETTSDKLHIANSASCTLIYGDFANKFVCVNNRLITCRLRVLSGATNGYVLTSDASGNATWQAGGGGGSLSTANNGLNVAGTNVRLGGALTGNTCININSGHLIITGGTGGGFGANISFSGVTLGRYIEDAPGNTEYLLMGDGNISLFEQEDENYASVSVSSSSAQLSLNNTGGTNIRWVCAGNEQVELLASDNTGSNAFLRVCNGEIYVAGVHPNGFSGITYGADYSACFTARSLVDKAYVDSQSGGGFTVANNGLSANTTTVTLGGNLTKQTCILGGASNFDLCLGATGCELGNVNVFVTSEFTVDSDNSTIRSANGNYVHIGEDVCISGNTYLATPPSAGSYTDSALMWDSGTTKIRKMPILEEWVTSVSALQYMGQKFSYPTHSVFMTDVATCSYFPNYIFKQNINLDTVTTTLLFTIPSGMKAFLNRAKLVMLKDATPTDFTVSIGNNQGGVSYSNLLAPYSIDDVLINDTYELPICACAIGIDTGNNCCAQVYFYVPTGSTASNNLCAHLLVEGFLY